MLETRSLLGAHASFECPGLSLREAPDFKLTQLAGDEKTLKKALGILPSFGTALESENNTLFRIAPDQIWVLGDLSSKVSVYTTPLSSSRTRFALEGEKARALLSACAPVDFSASQFTPDQYAMTGIHHTPALIHCLKANGFHIYAMRSFAHSVWEWLIDAAQGL
jgi:methylglutamate dehydrogenase subunit D